MVSEHLQEKVSTLEQEISETQTKLEETTKLREDRLKEAMEAENRIIDIKIDMQRFYSDIIYVFQVFYYNRKLQEMAM